MRKPRQFLSPNDFKTRYGEPTKELIAEAKIALARILVDYPFDEKQRVFWIHPANELDKVQEKIRIRPRAALERAIKECLASDWIAIEKCTRRVNPVYCEYSEALIELDDEEFQVIWGKPGLFKWWRQVGKPFVFNSMQSDIYAALNGRALKVQKIADLVAGSDRSRLYKPDTLKELEEAGLVKHKPRLGYYRPDAPPPAAIPKNKLATN